VLTEHGAKIAPRTFWAWAKRAPSKRALWDAAITGVLAGKYVPDQDGRRPPEALYGARKMWAHLHREGITVARCTVERLMRAHDWRGKRRCKMVRTTVPDPSVVRPTDLVDRQFQVEAPNLLLVADFTYVRLATGAFCYVAFVIDAFAGMIIGWDTSMTKHASFVESAIRQAVSFRARQGRPMHRTIHHSDAGSQYTAIYFGETLELAGLRPSIGTVGDAYDNALAETTIGDYKYECIEPDSPFRRGPLRGRADVDLITDEYVHWHNYDRLMHRLGLIPPAEAEAAHYAQPQDPESTESHETEGASNPG
jgi:putative transposase